MSTDALPLPDPALLPDDVAVLKQLVVQLLEQLRLRDERLQRQEHHIHLLLKRIYGSSSEKFDPQQGMLFDNQADAEEAAANSPSPPPVARAASKNRDKHGRGRIPDETEREEVVHDLSEAEKAALGGPENLVELPPETSEQLDWRPSTLFVTVHVRKKYARKEQLPESGLTLAEQNVAVARKPPEAIPGGLAGPGLMAQVIVSKGADHLPLHRLEGIFQRQGVRISRQTMDGWWLQTAEFLQPLYALAIRVVLASHVIHTDDTSVKVRDAWRKVKYTGHFWPYVGDPLHPLTVFDYTTNHKRDGPAAFLKDYRGYCRPTPSTVTTESTWNPTVESSRWLVGRTRGGNSTRADGWMRPAWRRRWLGSASSTRSRRNSGSAVRASGSHSRWRSVPGGSPPSGKSGRGRSWTSFHTWLEAESLKVLPKSAVRGAMNYTLGNWTALSVYPNDGWLDIDNNEGENSLRGLCIGRRNWLFVGSDRGGRAAAIHFSLLASCKRHGHDPWVYYRDVLDPPASDSSRRQRGRTSRPAPPPLASGLIIPARQAHAEAAISSYVLGGTDTMN